MNFTTEPAAPPLGEGAAPGLEASPDFPVVGIGASAGGVPALLRFFEHLPRHTGMAYVVILHLSPKHESHADHILENVAAIPVLQVRETVRIEPDHAYVISPARQLEMYDGHLYVSEHERHRGRPYAIDLFFRTLAQAHQSRAVCVVLSGTGSDGAVGLARVKEQGGVTLVQSPHDAEYEDMPRHAIQTGMVDMVLPVAEMPNKLLELWANAQNIQLPAGDEPIPAKAPPDAESAVQAEAALRDIMATLRERTGHDFKHYKRATVLRRIERRLQVRRLPTLPDYRDYIEANAGEARELLQDLLISVTNFFRDRDAFEALEREAVGPLFDKLPPGEPLRAWVAGCATGEEAYSVAILLAERAAQMDKPPVLQVFASDIDERAIAVARSGCYPESIVTDVPPSRLREFFNREPNHYRVCKPVRERVLFATHNVLHDPPFSRLQLIACRNLLIYLDREVQARVLQMFHFALEPGGYLFLGNSESAEAAEALFTVVDKKNRLYRARSDSRRRSLPFMALRVPGQDLRPLTALRAPQRPVPFADVHQRVTEQHAPPSVLTDSHGQIVHVDERAAEFLRPVSGSPTHELSSMVLPELRLELRTALFHATQTGRSVEARRARVEREGRPPLFVNITVRPVVDAHSALRLMLVVFDACEATLMPGPGLDAGQDPLVTELERELQQTREQLLGSIDNSQVSTEELRASNEELQAINEELRSATEELETSKEELQSVNEELITVNHELKLKVDETSKVNDDLRNLIGATDIATVFIDRAMRITRFTPRAAAVFNLISADVGRSLLDITHRLEYPELADDAGQAFESLRTIEREVRGTDGTWYLARVMPYRTLEDRIDGAVLHFIDVSTRRGAEEKLYTHEQRMRMVAESTTDHAIVTLDTAGRINSWNKGAERMFGYAPEEVAGQSIAMLLTQQDRDLGAEQDVMRTAREEGRADVQRWLRRKDGSRFFCGGVTTPMFEGDVLQGYAEISRDVTAMQLLEAERDALLARQQHVSSDLKAALAMKDEFLAIMSHELKNPLNLIHVNAELLMRLPQVQGVPAVARAAGIIRSNVKSQAKIIDDLLDLSRVNTGKLTLNPASLRWADLVASVADAVRTDAQAKQIALAVDLDHAVQPVFADAVRVEQIVWNLVSNALKFTPSGGRIVLRLRREGGFCRLDVEDSGRGIAPDFIGHVFDIFRQAQGPSTREAGGLGIGLALVKQIAELHGGRVAATSEGLGQGACFSVWLPVDHEAPTDPPAAGEGLVLEGLRVLLVDDTADALESFGALLSLLGARLRTAQSGAQALALAEAEAFDLVISDIGMPGMDGYELLRRLRALPSHASVPAIALTGFGRTEDRERALSVGYNSHLAKPVGLDGLLEVVARIVPGRSAPG